MIIETELHVLEFNKRVKKTEGQQDKVYHSLACFEYGREYPEILRVDVRPDLIDEAMDLAGCMCRVRMDMVMGKNWTRCNFVSGSIIEVVPIAS